MVNARALLTTVVEVLGLVVVCFGLWAILPALGVIGAGLALVLIGWRLA